MKPPMLDYQLLRRVSVPGAVDSSLARSVLASSWPPCARGHLPVMDAAAAAVVVLVSIATSSIKYHRNYDCESQRLRCPLSC